MLTVIIKRNAEPTVIQMTQEAIVRELGAINNSEMLLEDSWTEGLRKVRTPYVCLVEADCTLSANYLQSNVGLMRKTTQSVKGGGYNKLALIGSCLGYKSYGNRIYNYRLEKTDIGNNVSNYQVRPLHKKPSTTLHAAQVAFIPGAIMRMQSLKGDIDKLPWDTKNLIEMSTAVSFHFWNTNRRLQVNPNTTYVSNEDYLENPPFFDVAVPDRVANIFKREGL